MFQLRFLVSNIFVPTGLNLTKAAHSQFNRKAWHKVLSPFMSLWKKCNQGQEFVKMEIPEEDLSDSVIFDFIADEFRKAIILIHHIHKKFTSLSKIIKGAAIPDETDVSIANKLMSLEVIRTFS